MGKLLVSFLSPYSHRALADTFVPLRLNRHYRTTERSEDSLPPVILTTLCHTLARHNIACCKGIVTFYSDWHFLQGQDSPLGPVLTRVPETRRGMENRPLSGNQGSTTSEQGRDRATTSVSFM